MFTTIEDFLTNWGHESESTLKILDNLTDESLAQEVSPQDRTIGRIAWHITTTINEMLERTGLKFESVPNDSLVPSTAREIADAYRAASVAMVEALRSQWSNATLSEEVNMYGDMWSNATTLGILIAHQTHHRGQLTVLMRQAGLAVPGVYGPAREEWAVWGEQPPIV